MDNCARNIPPGFAICPPIGYAARPLPRCPGAERRAGGLRPPSRRTYPSDPVTMVGLSNSRAQSLKTRTARI
jgi:hypothetical protein